jgi:nucleoside-diphosphate-sugar epimerase
MTSANTHTHVIFGTGPMGAAIARQLLARGATVRLVNRSGKAPLDLPPVEVRAGDAYDRDFVREVSQGAAVVYQAAQPEYHEWPQKFPALQAAIIDGIAATGPTADARPKLIVVENLYMYGRVDAPMREDTPHKAHTRKGRTRAVMAEALLAAHQAGVVRAASGRGSDFFGPNDSLSGGFQFRPALAGKKVSGYGDIDTPHTMTYTEDFAKALVILGERDEALGQAWHVPNAPTVTMRQYIELIFEAAGVPSKIGAITPPMMRLAGLFSKGAGEMVEMMYEFTAPFVVDHSKFARAFGDHATSLRESVARTVAWFRAHPDFGH